MTMPTITDPQMARVMERIEYIVKVVDRLEPLALHLNSVQRDQEHMTGRIKQLGINTELLKDNNHLMDRRVLVLERWHKAMVGFSAFAASVILATAGYAVNYFKSVDQDKNDMNSRISSLEYVINAPSFEGVMQSDKPVATGSK